MADTRHPWAPTTTEERVDWEPTYYSHAVAIASAYAARHCYDLRVYQFVSGRWATGKVTSRKLGAVCAHPKLGMRAAPWCKLVALYDTLSVGGAGYAFVAWLDSDLYFHDQSRGVLELLSEYAPPLTRANSFAWFPDNWPFVKDSPVNSAFFVLAARGGRQRQTPHVRGHKAEGARSLISRWWGTNVSAHNMEGPFFEQAALTSMWPVAGAAILGAHDTTAKANSTWRFMTGDAFGGQLRPDDAGGTPVTHVLSLHNTQRRERAFRNTNLAIALDAAAARGTPLQTGCRPRHSGRTRFFAVHAFNDTLPPSRRDASPLAVERPPRFDKELKTLSQPTQWVREQLAAAEKAAMAAHVCKPAATLVPRSQADMFNSCLATEVGRSRCPIIGTLFAECAALCNERSACEAFLHTSYDHCFLLPRQCMVQEAPKGMGLTICLKRTSLTPSSRAECEADLRGGIPPYAQRLHGVRMGFRDAIELGLAGPDRYGIRAGRRLAMSATLPRVPAPRVYGPPACKGDEAPLELVAEHGSAEACFREVPGQFAGRDVYDGALARVVLTEPLVEHTVLEIGALMGQSSCFMAHRLRRLRRAHASLSVRFSVIDIWEPAAAYGWLGTLGFTREWDALRSRTAGHPMRSIRHVWEHYTCASAAASAIDAHIHGSSTDSRIAARFADGSVSFLYLDTTHALEPTVEELNLWWPKIRRGGWLCGDDYNAGFGVIAAVATWRADNRIKDVPYKWAPGQFCIGKGTHAVAQPA